MYEINETAIQNISLTKVDTDVDLQTVLALRVKGYRGVFTSSSDAHDDLDKSPNCDLLLAEDTQGTPLGTLRILNTLNGTLELDSLSSLYRDYFPQGTTFVEGTRLVATGNTLVPKQTVQAALWKATLDFAYSKDIDHLIVWAKKGPDRAYRFLKFNELPECKFCHPKLGGKEHRVFAMDVKRIRKLARKANHPLYDFFFEKRYESLIWY